MNNSSIKLDESWLNKIKSEFDKPYFRALKDFLKEEKKLGKVVYPKGSRIFAALDSCSFDDVQVVIIGQDPYHGPKQANGLCFSVERGINLPPSLSNIYRELKTNLDIPIASHGDLSHWARQGVLLLNAVLTVEEHKPGSHQNKGWESFTDYIIEKLNEDKKDLVFMLWGGYAKKKGHKISRDTHLVLESGHPSPLSANKGHWFGNKHFSKCNAYLSSKGLRPIDWKLD
jgi:uracil-DNA glycosylase